MTEEGQQATDNLTDYVRYQAVIMPLVAEMGRAVDLDEVVAEVTLDAADAPQHQIDFVIGMVERFKEMNEFLVSSVEAAS